MTEYQTYHIDAEKYVQDAGWSWAEIVRTADEGASDEDQHRLADMVMAARPGIGDEDMWIESAGAATDLETYCADLVQDWVHDAGLPLKSHSPIALAQAHLRGEQLWQLDSGTDGEDDTLIGDYTTVIGDVISYADQIGKYSGTDQDWEAADRQESPIDLPNGWTLTKVDWL